MSKNAAQNWWDKRSTGEKIAVGIAGYFIGKKIISSFLDDDNTGGTSGNLDFNQDNLTYPKNQYKIFADSIEVAFYGQLLGFTEDDPAVFAILNAMMTDDDVYALIDKYGYRGGSYLNVPISLPAVITKSLDDHYIDQINSIYAQRGMYSRFQ